MLCGVLVLDDFGRNSVELQQHIWKNRKENLTTNHLGHLGNHPTESGDACKSI